MNKKGRVIYEFEVHSRPDLENRAAHPNQELPGIPPGPRPPARQTGGHPIELTGRRVSRSN